MLSFFIVNYNSTFHLFHDGATVFTLIFNRKSDERSKVTNIMDTYSAIPLIEPDLDKLSWLKGMWTGRIGDDKVEEIWSGLQAGTMMGTFRWITGKKVRFYEFMTISKINRNAILKIKHFSPDLVGWEEKQDVVGFFLTELYDSRAIFYQKSEKKLWLVYEYIHSADELRVYFSPEKNSPVGNREFCFRRKRNSG